MEAITNDEFLKWAATVGVGFDPRYPAARSLRLLPPQDFARFWELPRDPASWPHFLASILDSLDPWSTGFLWPRTGRWPTSVDSSSPNDRVCDVVLRGAGIPDGWAGTVRFEYSESAVVLAVMFGYVAFSPGWDDLFFIPKHGRQSVQTDHHDVVHVRCATEASILQLVEHMKEAGYSLPTELPDETFKRPVWMTQPDD